MLFLSATCYNLVRLMLGVDSCGLLVLVRYFCNCLFRVWYM